MISTFEQLTGAALLPATFQVTVAVLLPLAAQLVALLCEVTVKGPAEASVFTVTEVWAVQPPPVASSRTITIKFSGRVTLGSTSKGVAAPLTRSAIRGNTRVLAVVGGKERKSGPL